MNEILSYNPLAQISETFSWKTAVNPCWSAEERIALRDDPSLSITYSYAIGSDDKLADFYDFSETNLGMPVRIPMWSSPHFHPGAVLSAATSISLTNSLLHYYLSPGDEVILWKAATNYSPLIVNTISSSAISFTTAIGSDFSAFYLLPLLTGRFNKAVNFTKGTGSRKRASLVFEILNFILPSPYVGYRVDKILQSIEFSTATAQDRELVSSALGIYENLPTSEITKESWKGGFNFASPSDLVDFLILLKLLKGRAVSFPLPYTYLSPTGSSAVVLSSDSVTVEHSFPRRASVSLELEGAVPSALPTYLLTPDVTSVSEGSSVTFTVTTTGVPDGTVLAWEVVPGTTTLTDTSPNSRTVTIQNNTATFQVTAQVDILAEASESFTVRLTDHPETVSAQITIPPDYVLGTIQYRYWKLVDCTFTEAQARLLRHDTLSAARDITGFSSSGTSLTTATSPAPSVIYFRDAILVPPNPQSKYAWLLNRPNTIQALQGRLYEIGDSWVLNKAEAILTLTGENLITFTDVPYQYLVNAWYPFTSTSFSVPASPP